MISIFYGFHKFIDGLILDYSVAAEDFDKTFDNSGSMKSGRRPVDIHLMTQRFLKESINLHAGIVK